MVADDIVITMFSGVGVVMNDETVMFRSINLFQTAIDRLFEIGIRFAIGVDRHWFVHRDPGSDHMFSKRPGDFLGIGEVEASHVDRSRAMRRSKQRRVEGFKLVVGAMIAEVNLGTDHFNDPHDLTFAGRRNLADIL